VVSGFLLGLSKVPGSFDIEETETGVRWRYSKADTLQLWDESISEKVRPI